jgi:hypothetical protein
MQVDFYVLRQKLLQRDFLLSTKLSAKIKTAAANSVFIKLWLDVKHWTLNHYFAFVVN